MALPAEEVPMPATSALYFAPALTRLGWIVVMMTSRGVADLVFPTQDVAPKDLIPILKARYRGARLMRDDGAHRAWVDAVVAHIDGATSDIGAPLDVRLRAESAA